MLERRANSQTRTDGCPPEDRSEVKQWVLVMDDQPTIRENLAELLRNLGYNVIQSAEGREAVAHVAGMPDVSRVMLAILDLQVSSGLGGKETAIQLRRMNPDLNIIISTGQPEVDSDEELDRIGIQGILFKPYDLLELQTVLDNLDEGNR